MPIRGWGRKAPRAPPLELEDAQETFLNGKYVEDTNVTSYHLKEMLDKEFKDNRRLQLEEEDVQRWLSKTYGQVRRAAAAEQQEEGEGE